MFRFLIFLVLLNGVVSEDAVEDPTWTFLSYYRRRMDYLDKTLTKLIHYKSRYNLWEVNPDPMNFEPFAIDNHEGIIDTGSFHVKPTLHGYSAANCTPVVNYDTKEAMLYVHIPEANITGDYDIHWIRSNLQTGYTETTTGNGSFHHSFKNVKFSVKFTVRMNNFYNFTLAENHHTQMSMDSCQIWWDNYAVNGEIWDEIKWIDYSRQYCEEFSSGWERSSFQNSRFISKLMNQISQDQYNWKGSFTEEEALTWFNWFMFGAEDDTRVGYIDNMLSNMNQAISPI